MKPIIKVTAGIAGILVILASLYQGLAMSGVFPRPVIEGYWGGILPTVLALLGALCMSLACRKE